MVPPARDAHIDFVRLAAEEPSSMYFEEFLRDGYETWPRPYQEQFPGLATWSGVGGLKQSLRRIAGVSSDWRVLLASRSLPLLKLGVGCQFRVCRNVLTTDLSWPTYQHAVTTVAQCTRNHVSIAAIRDRVFNDGWTAADVAQHLAVEYERCKCDGLFLPAVDHLGIRVPLGRIVETIKAVAELRFVLVDAAQALCHVSLDECTAHADFIVAGSHKWMGAYLPLGVAYYGRVRSKELIDRRAQRQLIRQHGDPLRAFVEQIDSGALLGPIETVCLPGLITAAGAAADPPANSIRWANSKADVAEQLAITPRPVGDWKYLAVAPELRSQIAIVERTAAAKVRLSADDVRRDWLEAGCIVSAYDGGVARLSFSGRYRCPDADDSRHDALLASSGSHQNV